MMNLTLRRAASTAHSTPGMLSLNGEFVGHTLEDVVRPIKIAGKTAIPSGGYRIIINDSARFKRRMPLLLDVPGFDGIRIHPGNTDADTEGCILIGTDAQPDRINNSRMAFDNLFERLDAAFKAGERITINIIDAPTVPPLP